MTQQTVMVDGTIYSLTCNNVLSKEQIEYTINQIRLQTNTKAVNQLKPTQNYKVLSQYNNPIVSMVTGCNKPSAVVGDVLTLSATPSGGPSGTSYTVKLMEQTGSGTATLVDTKTSTGEQVTANYTLVATDNNANVQTYAVASYVCSDDGTTKTGTSTKCNTAVGETPQLYRCNQTTGQCEPCNGTSAKDCYDDCITKCGYDFECLMKCMEECEGGTPTPTATPTTSPCVPLAECQAQCGITPTTTPTVTPTIKPTVTPTVTPTTTPTVTPTIKPTVTPTVTPTTTPTPTLTNNLVIVGLLAAVGIGAYILYQKRKTARLVA